MDILNSLKQLRDDLKTWVTNNLTALDKKISNKVDRETGKGLFSGDYKDLRNTPNIAEDNNGNLTITDTTGNIVFRVKEDGAEILNLSVENITINGMTIQEIVNACVEEALKNQNN